MRDLARLGALLVAALVVARGVSVGGGVPAMWTATYLCVAVVALATTLWREGFVTASGVALGVHYALALHYGDVVADFGAPVVAALVVVHVDLLDLAASVPRERHVDRPFLRARLRHAVVVFVVGVAASALALAVASLPWPSSTLTRAIGLAGVALAVVIPLGLLRERR
jgi:hypothetical protein